MGFLADGWKGRRLPTRTNFAFSVVSSQELHFHCKRVRVGLELVAKDAAALKKGAGKNLFCRPAGSDNLQPQTRKAAEVGSPSSGAKQTGIRRSSGQLPHTGLLAHHKGFCCFSSLVSLLLKQRQKIIVKATEWKQPKIYSEIQDFVPFPKLTEKWIYWW